MRIEAKAKIPRESLVLIRNFSVNVLSRGAMDGLEEWAEEVVRTSSRSQKQAPKPRVPSPPGTPPNRQSGRLATTMKVRRTPRVIRIDMPFYGSIHESGGSKHPARPFIRPAEHKHEGDLLQRIENSMKNADQKTPLVLGAQRAYPTAKESGLDQTLTNMVKKLGTKVQVRSLKKQWGANF